MSHYLTQNSNIRAPLCWEADILQMAIRYQFGFGQNLFILSFRILPIWLFLEFWMFPESPNA